MFIPLLKAKEATDSSWETRTFKKQKSSKRNTMAGANRLYWPRRGSMQIWPRSRASRIYPVISNVPPSTVTKLSGFMAYKVGMTHIIMKDTNPHSHTKNQQIFCPVTILECPTIKPLLLRFYQKTTDGLQIVGEIPAQNVDKKYKLTVPKKTKEPQTFDELRLVIYTTPETTGMSKKNPDVIEIPIVGASKEEQLKLGKEFLTKKIKLADVFKEGQMVDIRAVTKGKGFQGTVKRFGVKIRQHKSEKTKRGIGTLGPWTPKKVLFTVAQGGKMGFHSRVDYNKQILKINQKPEEINPTGGIGRYGKVKGEYVLIRGSLPGPKKRSIVLTDPMRPRKTYPVEISYVSREN